MNSSKLSILLLAVIMLVVTPVTTSAAKEETDWRDAPWRFNVKGYGWLPKAPVTIKIDQVKVANMPESFNNIFNSMEFSAMFELEAHKGRLGFFVSPVYYKGKDSQKFTGLAGESRKITLKETVWAIDYGVGYEIVQQWPLGDKPDSPTVTVEPFLGALYLHDPIKIDLNPGAFDIGLKIRKTITFNTPIVGFNTLLRFADRWDLRASVNYGGWNVNNVEKTYQFIGLLGYHFKMKDISTQVFVGYRYLKIHYDDNLLDINVAVQGPLVGIGWEF